MTKYEADCIEAFCCVGWGHNDDCENANWLYFDDLEVCLNFAEIQKGTFRCVWVAELGRYKSRNGKIIFDWIYKWWSDGCESAGQRPEYRKGTPDHLFWGNIVDYTPLRTSREGSR